MHLFHGLLSMTVHHGVWTQNTVVCMYAQLQLHCKAFASEFLGEELENCTMPFGPRLGRLGALLNDVPKSSVWWDTQDTVHWAVRHILRSPTCSPRPGTQTAFMNVESVYIKLSDHKETSTRHPPVDRRYLPTVSEPDFIAADVQNRGRCPLSSTSTRNGRLVALLIVRGALPARFPGVLNDHCKDRIADSLSPGEKLLNPLLVVLGVGSGWVTQNGPPDNSALRGW